MLATPTVYIPSTPPIEDIQSSWNLTYCSIMMLSSTYMYIFKVAVHQILILTEEVMPFLKFLLTFYFLANSSYSLYLIKLKQYIVGPWCGAVHIDFRLQSLPLLLTALLTIPVKTLSMWLNGECAFIYTAPLAVLLFATNLLVTKGEHLSSPRLRYMYIYSDLSSRWFTWNAKP